MITEDYVSFEIAKLLEVKGFNFNEIESTKYYVTKSFSTGCPWNSATYEIGNITREYSEGKVIPLITLQMACKWLVEKHNLFIEPYVVKNYDKKKLEYTYSIQNLDFNGSDDGIDCCDSWDKPEEAIEAALQYVLKNLI